MEEFEIKYFETKAMLIRARNSKSHNKMENSTILPNETQLNDQVQSNNSDNQLTAAMHNFLSSQQTFFENLNHSREQSANSRICDVRLPRLQIPSFSGDFKQWPSFSDLFEKSVHNNENLNACQKLQYLKGLLLGEAASVIRHLTITDGNYVEAWEKLKARYDKKRHITTAMIKTFIETQSIGSPSVKQLRHVYDTFDEVIRGLRALGEDSQRRDPWLIYLALSKLDAETKQLWAKESSERDFPTFADFLNFLNKRCDAMEISVEVNKRSNMARVLHASSPAPVKPSCCSLCNGNHFLFQCAEFKAKRADQRKSFVVKNSICFNCLRPGHSVSSCRSKARCNLCKRSHHTLLHEAGNNQLPPQPSSSFQNTTVHPASFDSSANIAYASDQSEPSINTTSNPISSILNPTVSTSTDKGQNLSSFNTLVQHGGLPHFNAAPDIISLLPTALVNVTDYLGRLHLGRVLLDSGSQVSFISETFVQRLALRREHAKLSISGVASLKSGFTKGKVTLQISPHFDKSIKIYVEAYIMNTLTSFLPSVEFDITSWKFLKNCRLADPSFNKPASIDVIIGADKFFELLKEGKIQEDSGLPLAQETIFGWVLAGRGSSLSNSAMNFHVEALVDIDLSLKRFWEAEDLGSDDGLLTTEERLCEQNFCSNTKRDKQGRYVVSLPFKPHCPMLGQSMPNAIKRFQSTERRFQRDKRYKEQYSNFMRDYLQLGHMQLIPEEEINEHEYHKHFYLPHHAVFKQPDAKIRVVFDGSAKTTTGVSLNDTLMVGAVVQRDLFSILVSFRKHLVAFSADIEKMYRQVQISNNDKDFQRIVWRDNPTERLKHYRLSTVTYGTSSAPFLATRVLKQIALDHKTTHPNAAAIIKQDFYVDDLLSGTSSVDEATSIKSELIQILSNNGFNLTKWKSNLSQSPHLDSAAEDIVHIDETSSITKVLGVVLNLKDDIFSFHVSSLSNERPTKRRLLSESSRIFDPLGFLAPATISIKILFQRLWLLNLGWDDQLPPNLAMKWYEFKSTLSKISEIRIPRHVCPLSHCIELHGFADASELAFGAVVYCRSLDENGVITVRLVTAKTKVAPLKQVSLPRLELCAALLLTRLMVKVTKALTISNLQTWAWTDSSIVLSWLSDTPRRWKAFVGNRTSEILNSIPRNQWKHVPSDENPADQASRGTTPAELLKSNLWWNGPAWLQGDPSSWPSNEKFPAIIPTEERKNPIILSHEEVSNSLLSVLLTRCSSWTKLLRILSYITRFTNNCRRPRLLRETEFVKYQEIKMSEILVVNWVQREAFPDEIKCLSLNKEVSAKSQLISLYPYLDEHQSLRVGGRLHRSNLSFNAKHPRILPKDHEITKLIVKDRHVRYLHPGIELLINIIRQEYWIVRIRHVVKQVTHQCISCFRQRTRDTHQLMGNLPEHRVTSARPFLRSGVDFAGPVHLITRTCRGAKSFKAYIALFVCFSTKALHLEVVSSLSSDAFLGAFRRFIARRGIPTDMYSDNGTNFVGANRKLSSLHNQALQQFKSDSLISHFISENKISWHFIPPVSPHFGGLWEAGVKAVKTHLQRVIGEKKLTFEEMTTLLVQIEGILNSRPLCPLSEDPSSLDVLTPSHFLIGEPLTAIPEPDQQELNISRLGRWQQIQAMTQGFWRRWSRDYLTSLQQRPKWRKLRHSLQEGDLVIISEDNVPPSRWIMGRIEVTYPGTDGVVRVVAVRTAKGIYKRSVNKIHRLPINE